VVPVATPAVNNGTIVNGPPSAPGDGTLVKIKKGTFYSP
jgi:hypothetical protein